MQMRFVGPDTYIRTTVMSLSKPPSLKRSVVSVEHDRLTGTH